MTSAMLVAKTTRPALGYELSLFGALSPIFWGFQIGSLLSVTGTVLIVIFRRLRKPLLTASSFLGVVMNYTFLLSLPAIRSYFLGFGPGWDALTHIGEMQRIVYTGNAGPLDFYPVLHVFGGVTSILTNVPVVTLGAYFPSVFLWFYFGSVTLLGRILESREDHVTPVFLLSIPLLFSYGFRSILPAYLSLFGIPLFLYFWHLRSSRTSGRTAITILIVLTAFFVTFTHPITTLVLIALVIVLTMRERMRWRFSTTRARSTSESSSNLVLILVTAFIAWYLSNAAILGSARVVLDWLSTQALSSPAQEYYHLGTLAGLSLQDTVWIVFLLYGPVIMFLVLALVSMTAAFLSTGTNRNNSQPSLKLYSVLFVVTLAISTIFFIGYFVERDLTRILRFPLLMSIPLSGLFFSDVRLGETRLGKAGLRRRYRAITAVTVAVVLVTTPMLVVSAYGSPTTLSANEQVTWDEAAGMTWFLQHGNRAIPAVSNINVHRFEDLLLCFHTDACDRFYAYPGPIPTHFEYGSGTTLAQSTGFSFGYLITTGFDRVSWMTFPPDLLMKKEAVYLPQDFDVLVNDPGFNLVYTAGPFQIWTFDA